MRRACGLLAIALPAATAPLDLAPGAAPPAAFASSYVRVVKPYGAAIRAAPAGEAEILYTATCGQVFPVLGRSEGWWQVEVQVPTGALVGWVGGARVSAVEDAQSVLCADWVTFQVGDPARVTVPAGCLSLRAWPSREAPYEHCARPGHVYRVVDGPLEVAGEDWFEVWSEPTGGGWSLAERLLPAH